MIESKDESEEPEVNIKEIHTNAFLEEICQKAVWNSNKKSTLKTGSNEEQTTEKQAEDEDESVIRGEDIHAEVEFLHKENAKMKERMSVLEKSLVDIYKSHEAIKSEFQDHEVKVSKQLNQAERNLEAKLQFKRRKSTILGFVPDLSILAAYPYKVIKTKAANHSN